MMILELDCGNSLIKWRVLNAGLQVAESGMADSNDALIAELDRLDCLQVARMVSVRGDEETAGLAELLHERLGIEVRVAEPATEMAGVINAYADYQRLGLDRWLALVAGWRRCCGPVAVIDIGTAITVDFVDGSGQHLGGLIGPGLGLMRRSLLNHTQRIRYQPGEEIAALDRPGTNTRDAVERGCRSMLLAFCRSQGDYARELLGPDVKIIVTGGDAMLLGDWLQQAVLVPDLVFEGLALACPVQLEGECV